MGKVAKFKHVIKEVFQHYAETRIPNNEPNPGYQLIFDEERGHYLLYRTTWKDELRRIHFCVFHIDIIDKKIWVQEDSTDYDLVGVLEEQGISKEDIVLAFHEPGMRQYTDFAVAS